MILMLQVTRRGVKFLTRILLISCGHSCLACVALSQTGRNTTPLQHPDHFTLVMAFVLSRGQVALISVGSSAATLLLVALFKKILASRPAVNLEPASQKESIPVSNDAIVAVLKDIAATLKELTSISREQAQTMKEQPRKLSESAQAAQLRTPRPPPRTEQPKFQYDTESDTEDIFEDLPTSSLDVVALPSADSPALFLVWLCGMPLSDNLGSR